MDAEKLGTTLSHKITETKDETFVIPIPPEAAVGQRDALAKYIYERVFNFVVDAVNAALGRTGLAPQERRSIAVLDIFGFEIFDINSFEQLCINYCNERLQTFFNEHFFRAEAALYESEGLTDISVPFLDNSACVHLVDAPGIGMFNLLDEEGSIGKGSDQGFVNKCNNMFSDSGSTKSPFYQKEFKNQRTFRIRHFAGDVCYDAQGFIEKNKDALFPALTELIRESEHCIMKSVHQNLSGQQARKSEMAPKSARKSQQGQDAVNRMAAKRSLAGKFKVFSYQDDCFLCDLG